MKFLDESTRKTLKVDDRYAVPLIWRDDKVELPAGQLCCSRSMSEFSGEEA